MWVTQTACPTCAAPLASSLPDVTAAPSRAHAVDAGKFSGLLLENEVLLWRGNPDPHVVFTQSDLIVIPWSLMLSFPLSFALFALPSVFGADGLIHAIGGGFALVLILIGRFFAKAWVKSHTTYLVTNQRIIIVGPRAGGRGANMIDVPWQDYPPHVRRHGGYIDLVFRPRSRPLGGRANWFDPFANTGIDILFGDARASGKGTIAFYDVMDDRNGYDLLAIVLPQSHLTEGKRS